MPNKTQHARSLHHVKVNISIINCARKLLQRLSLPSTLLAVPVIPEPTIRDPRVRIIRYLLPDSMYFFEQTYRRIWVRSDTLLHLNINLDLSSQISNKGYITFGTPFYGRTMTTPAFHGISEQAIAAPFWADLLFDNVSSARC